MKTKVYTYFIVILAFLFVITACKDSTSSQEDEPEENTPSTPVGLSVMPGDEEVFLTWDANGETDLSHYNIYQGTTIGDLEEVAEVPAGTENYTATDLSNDMTYYFAIDGENTEGNKSEPTNEVNVMPIAKYLVVGSALSGIGGNVRIRRKGEDVDGAVVTVNDELLEELGNGSYYKYPFDLRVPEGGTLELKVMIDGKEIMGTGMVPYHPEVTSPADSTFFSSGDTIQVVWTCEADPNRFDILGRFDDDGTTYEGNYNLLGDARETDLAANLFPSDSRDIEIYSVAYNDGEFSGPYAEGSTMGIRTTTPATARPIFFVKD